MNETVSSLDESLQNQIVFYGVNIGDRSLIDDEYGLPSVYTERLEALNAVKKHKGARFKCFTTRDEALEFSAQNLISTPIASERTKIFTSSPCCENVFESAVVAEKSSPFKSLKSQETVKLRKLIEGGDSKSFEELVWTNPRYLISSGDTPTILQEGFHYNGLHVAAKSKQAELCQLILTTIENDKFLRLLFPDDTDDIFYKRKNYILDLYINMPDKGMFETPLHFACKFGCLNAVKVLLSSSSCDRTLINKYSKTARQSICDRNGDNATKNLIDALFEAQYYIPVLRSTGNSIQPMIGKPYSLDGYLTAIKNTELPGLINPLLDIKAKAGPMPLNKVNLFYRKWKLPQPLGSPLNNLRCSSNSSLDNSVRLRDSEKGLERIGRKLAQEFNVLWTEYWAFMNCWCDISSKEGLQLLENHLSDLRKLKTEEIQVANNLSNFSESYLSSFNTSLSPMSVLCNRLEKFHLCSTPIIESPATNKLSPKLSPDNINRSEVISNISARLNFDQEFKTGIKRKRSDDDISSSMNSAENEPNQIESLIINSTIVESLALYLKDSVMNYNIFKPFLEDLMEESKLSFNVLVNSALHHSKDKLPIIHKVVALNVVLILKENLQMHELKLVGEICQSMLMEKINTSDENFSTDNEPQNINLHRRSVLPRPKSVLFQRHLQCILKYIVNILQETLNYHKNSCLCFWDQNSESIRQNCKFNDESSSSQNTSKESEENCSSDEDEFLTPSSSRCSSPMETPEEIIDIFVKGINPSKADIDVLNALEETDIDPSMYPNVKLWKHCLNCYPKEVHKMWESPALMKIRMQAVSAPSKLNTSENENCLSRSKVPKFTFSTPTHHRTTNFKEINRKLNFPTEL